jgi:hypothetical protein
VHGTGQIAYAARMQRATMHQTDISHVQRVPRPAQSRRAYHFLLFAERPLGRKDMTRRTLFSRTYGGKPNQRSAETSTVVCRVRAIGRRAEFSASQATRYRPEKPIHRPAQCVHAGDQHGPAQVFPAFLLFSVGFFSLLMVSGFSARFP